MMKRTCRGVTLVEALVSLVIISVLAGGTFAILVLARNTSNTLAMSTVANTRASFAVRQMVRDLREGMHFRIAETDHVEIALPQVDSDGNYLLPLQVGDYVSYYLSDGTGQLGSAGNTLWRAVRTPGEAHPTPQKIVMEDVTSLVFTYIPSSTSAHTVQLSIVARGKSGPRTVQLTHNQMVKLRNYSL